MLTGLEIEKLAGWRLGVFQDFLDGGIAVVDITQAVLAQGVHTQLDGFLFDDDGGSALGDEVADRVSDVE